MNTALRNGADAFVARYQGLQARLPGDAAIRAAAAETFTRHGLPSVKEEAWRYTSLRALAESNFQEPLTEVSSAPILGDVIDAPRVVLVDGRYQPGLSTPPAGVTVTAFTDKPYFGRLPDAALPMVALNTMLAEDGVQLHVAAGVDAGVLLMLAIAPDGHRPIAFHPRHSIHLEPGAKLTVVEIARGEGSYFHNAVTEAVVAEGATLTHIRLQDEGPDAYHVNTTFAEVAERGTFDTFVLTLGARIARTEIHARLIGPNGMVHLNGAQLLGGQQHGDITTIVAHDAPNCGSRQTVKNVLSDRSRGVFQGRIEVARAAQKTDGYQMNQALLLSPHAEIDCKPQLEIYADDVKCSHGATVGELDADQLFYLRSRGVPDAEARAILVRAFLAEAMDPIAHPDARALLERAIEQWWERRV
ncbi:MAG: Fe-S cluster assembly protein SufD [Gemmatimonadaceae bacterium]|nr:Fe-S cluster assembly protein SufD [Acetobacteraceae bacterium]